MMPFIILNVCLAAGFTFGKAALTYMHPLLFIALRMIIAGMFLVGYQYFAKKEDLAIKAKDRGLFAGICFLHIYVSYSLEYLALQYVSASKASLLFNLSPFFSAFFAYIWSYEIMTPYKWLGLAIGFIGMLPIMVESSITEAMSGMIGFLSYAELMLLGSIASAAIGWILMRKLVHGSNYSPITINGLSMFTGGCLAFVSSLFYEGMPQILIEGPYAWLIAFFYVGLLILLCNVISYNLYAFLLKRYTATFLSFTSFTTPLFAALLAAIFFKELPSQWFFVSVVVVGIGLYIFYKEETRLEQIRA